MGDVILKRAWETNVAGPKCVARNLYFWLSQLQDHVKNGTAREEIPNSLPVVFKAVGYIVDSSAESVKLATRSGGLAVVARRAICRRPSNRAEIVQSPPFWRLTIGARLDEVLERTADRKESFPTENQKSVQKRFFFFVGKRSNLKKTGRITQKNNGLATRGSQGAIFSLALLAIPQNSDYRMPIGGRLATFSSQWQKMTANGYALNIIVKGYSGIQNQVADILSHQEISQSRS